ncbi:GFA family protein [Ahrensia sp. R2A130]|uniref:GFA family protein n=1 Tax=Ahrensia sp. R2A130 TaxID=744979 RepID=UPI0001E0F068|nr:GFA family protein [Ahrensia sp. R2A130]EFL90418.1 glutathione-dependent formaldehyde-activating GFA [Ahrensia sp. R2A130]
MTRNGSCSCGAITFRTTGSLRELAACHCSQCRKQSGHFYVATDSADSDLAISDPSEKLNWYAASDIAKRGFCGTCGSAMFWKVNDSDTTSILLGSFDGETGLTLDRHIFVADKGDYYDIPTDAKRFDGDDLHDPRPRRG